MASEYIRIFVRVHFMIFAHHCQGGTVNYDDDGDNDDDDYNDDNDDDDDYYYGYSKNFFH